MIWRNYLYFLAQNIIGLLIICTTVKIKFSLCKLDLVWLLFFPPFCQYFQNLIFAFLFIIICLKTTFFIYLNILSLYILFNHLLLRIYSFLQKILLESKIVINFIHRLLIFNKILKYIFRFIVKVLFVFFYDWGNKFFPFIWIYNYLFFFLILIFICFFVWILNLIYQFNIYFFFYNL